LRCRCVRLLRASSPSTVMISDSPLLSAADSLSVPPCGGEACDLEAARRQVEIGVQPPGPTVCLANYVKLPHLRVSSAAFASPTDRPSRIRWPLSLEYGRALSRATRTPFAEGSTSRKTGRVRHSSFHRNRRRSEFTGTTRSYTSSGPLNSFANALSAKASAMIGISGSYKAETGVIIRPFLGKASPPALYVDLGDLPP